MTPEPSPTHYEILDLPPSLQNEPYFSPQTLRTAYRRSLLRWHPDKANTNLTLKSPPSATQPKFSIDQISTAYTTLCDTRKRREYDRELKARNSRSGNENGNGWNEERKFKAGVEAVDLDDLEHDESQGIWYRGCRCGDESGYEVRESDLEAGEGDAEVLVGCRGCSLWLRVLFAVVQDGEGVRNAEGVDGGVDNSRRRNS
jgi:DnaJ-class molecular chaperone